MPDGKSLPVDYEMEGAALGASAWPTYELQRYRRNNVIADGVFTSSEIRKVIVRTENSVYRVAGKPSCRVAPGK